MPNKEDINQNINKINEKNNDNNYDNANLKDNNILNNN